MSGHSKFKNIMHRKGAQDKRKAKIFTRAVKEIIVSAKNGMPDPNFNPRLRAAIITAKHVNLPKDKIDNAIKKATSTNHGIDYEEVIYEGYGPSGVAIIVEVLTDNKNRTTADIRSTLNKNGGTLGVKGSVRHIFKKVGYILYEEKSVNKDSLIQLAIELEADDFIDHNSVIEISCNIEKYSQISDDIRKKFGKPLRSEMRFSPNMFLSLNEKDGQKVLILLDMLDNLDDVQSVSSNCSLLN